MDLFGALVPSIHLFGSNQLSALYWPEAHDVLDASKRGLLLLL